jgi:hypothetical protein
MRTDPCAPIRASRPAAAAATATAASGHTRGGMTTSTPTLPAPVPAPLGGTGLVAPLGRLLPAPVPVRPAPDTVDSVGVEAVRLDEGRVSMGRIASRLGWTVDTALVCDQHPHHLTIRVADPTVTVPVPSQPVQLEEHQRRLRLPAGFPRVVGMRSGDTVLAWLMTDESVQLFPAWAFAPARPLIAAGDLDPRRTERLRHDLDEQRRLNARLTGQTLHH